MVQRYGQSTVEERDILDLPGTRHSATSGSTPPGTGRGQRRPCRFGTVLLVLVVLVSLVYDSIALRGGRRHQGVRERDRRTGVSPTHTLRPSPLTWETACGPDGPHRSELVVLPEGVFFGVSCLANLLPRVVLVHAGLLGQSSGLPRDDGGEEPPVTPESIHEASLSLCRVLGSLIRHRSMPQRSTFLPLLVVVRHGERSSYPCAYGES